MKNKIRSIVWIGAFLIIGNSKIAKAVEKGTIFYIPGVMSAAIHDTDLKTIIGNVHVKNTVPVVEEKGSYYKIVADGWVEKSKIKLQENKIKALKKGVTKEETELLDQPNKKSGKLYCSIRKWIEVYILEEQSDWIKVRISGWTEKGLLVENPKAETPKKAEEKGNTEKKPVEILKWDWSDAGNSILIRGIVKNNSDKTFHFLKLKISVKDKNDTLLGDGESYIGRDEFKPGSQASFSTYIDGATTDSNSIKMSYDWTSADDEIKED